MILNFKAFNERVDVYRASKASKKLLTDGGVPLKSLNVEAVGKNIAFYLEEKGNFMFPKGKFYVYFYDHHENVQKLALGEYDMIMFPFRRRFDMSGRSPINDIWKKNHAKGLRGTEHILGAIEGQVYEKDKQVLIQMMSVRPGFKSNKINTFLVEAVRQKLESDFPDYKLAFEDPTEDGLEFIAKYNPNAVIYWTFSNRPKNWKNLKHLFTDVQGKPENSFEIVKDSKPSNPLEI